MSEEKIMELSLMLYQLSIDKDVSKDESFKSKIDEFRKEFKEQMFILKDIDLY